MIPLAVPNLTGNERKYLNQCIDTTFVSSVGEFVNRIEELGASLCEAKYGVAVSSGTTGLHLSLLACGVHYGDIVIIPSFTFIATANAVAHCGAIPWLMDIDENWTIAAEQLEKELTNKTIFQNSVLLHKESGRRVAAIMPVYTLGNVSEMDEINGIAAKYGLPVIADAAAAIGARYKGRNIGGLAKLSVLSFNGNKTVTAGGGGLILGNDADLMKKIKHLSTTARVTVAYDHDMIGYNYRMTNLQAAVGVAQLERLEMLVRRKREIHLFYRQAFTGLSKVSFFPDIRGEGACWFSGLVLDKDINISVQKLCDDLRNDNIEARSFWKPVHLQRPYKNAYKADTLSITDDLWQRIITLPCSTGITDRELELVARKVKEKLVMPTDAT